ncbi:MAG: DUF2232 domain-containing protein [Pseudomonadota bacterium]
MTSSHIIAIAAGLLAANFYVGYANASVFALLFVILTALPIAVVSIGWGLYFGLIASLIALVPILILITDFLSIASFKYALGFFTFFCIPSLILAHLFYLSRPVDTSAPQAVPPQNVGTDQAANTEQDISYEWYPTGHLVMWMSVMAGVLTCAFLFQFADGITDYLKKIDTIWEHVFSKLFTQMSGEPLSQEAIADLKQNLAISIPTALSLALFFLIYSNFWIAAKIVQGLQKLNRPLPNFMTIEFPGNFFIAFIVSILAATFLVGYLKFFAIAFLSAFTTAYFFMGLMVIHAILEGSQFKTFTLFSLYFLLLVFGWLGLVLVIIGLAEPIINLRGKAPPSSSS